MKISRPVLILLLAVMCLVPSGRAQGDGDASAISSGTTVQGEIKVPGQTDRYAFEGEAGDSIIVIFTRTSGNLRPSLELYDPDGKKAAGQYNSPELRIDAVLEISGTYIIMVAGENTGQYTLSFKNVSDGTGFPVSSGVSLQSQIVFPGQVDWLSFEGRAGDYAVIHIARASGDLRPSLEILGPDGKKITGKSTTSPALRMDAVLESSGTYLLMVKCSGTGFYALTYKNVSEGAEGTGNAIMSGQTLPGEIKVAGLADWYIFEAEAGDSVVINLVRVSGDLRPSLELFGPNSKKIAEKAATSAELRLDAVLETPGIYTIMVAGSNTGPYALSFKDVSEGTGTPVSPGEMLEGIIELPGQMEWYTFEGKAGDSVTITVSPASGDLRPSLELYNPLGSRISGDSAGQRIDTVLEAPGTYTIMVKGGGTGAYDLAFTSIAPDAPETDQTTLPAGVILAVQKGSLTDAAAGGDMLGAFSFSSLELVTLNSGDFKGKGFVKGQWTARLEGGSYTGEFRGMLISRVSEGVVSFKGVTSGEIIGTMDGSFMRKISSGRIYDGFYAAWNIGRIKSRTVSGRVEVTGLVDFMPLEEYAETQVRSWQTTAQGMVGGDNRANIDGIVTNLLVDDEKSPYDGEGFSVISYNYPSGSGEGWAYAEEKSDSAVGLEGMFTGPLSGRISGRLEGDTSGSNLNLTSERVDIGASGTALKVEILGPHRVSPGQTVDYVIECRNDGLKEAEEVLVFYPLDNSIEYISASSGCEYDDFYRQVSADLGTMEPLAVKNISIKVKINEGLPWGTELDNFAYLADIQAGESSNAVNSAAFNGIWTPMGSRSWKQWQTFADKLGIQTVPIYQNPLSDIGDVLRATPNYSEEMALDEDDKPKEPQAISNIDGKNYYVYFQPNENNGLTNSALVNPPKPYVDVVAFSGGTRSVVTAMVCGKLRCNRLILVSPISGAINEKMYRWELEQIRKQGTEIVIYKGDADKMAGGADFKAGEKWLKDNNIIFNPDEIIINGKKLDIKDDTGEADFSKTGHTKMIEFLKSRLKPESQSSQNTITLAVARDPNIMYGPEGYVSQGEKLTYKVEYENEGEGIGFGVYFTNTLPDGLDDSTLEIGPVISTIDGSVIAPEGVYNPDTRTITWQVGEVGPGEGGFSEYTINVNDDTPDSMEIINYATVYFPSVPETTRTNGIVSVVGFPEPESTAPPATTAAPSTVAHTDEETPAAEGGKGFPLWGWLVAGAVLIVIIIIASSRKQKPGK